MVIPSSMARSPRASRTAGSWPGVAEALPAWALGPFSRPKRILEDAPAVSFACPVASQAIAWASKDIFNPAAVVQDGRVCLLVRAEDHVGRYAGTSRIGLATSADGLNFVQ